MTSQLDVAFANEVSAVWLGTGATDGVVRSPKVASGTIIDAGLRTPLERTFVQSRNQGLMLLSWSGGAMIG